MAAGLWESPSRLREGLEQKLPEETANGEGRRVVLSRGIESSRRRAEKLRYLGMDEEDRNLRHLENHLRRSKVAAIKQTVNVPIYSLIFCSALLSTWLHRFFGVDFWMNTTKIRRRLMDWLIESLQVEVTIFEGSLVIRYIW